MRGELSEASHPVTELAESGVAIFADTLGGLEALAFECRERKIPVHEAGVGPVTRATVMRQATVKEPTHRAVVAFGVPLLPEATTEAGSAVHLVRADVMYRAIEEYLTWQHARQHEMDVSRWAELVRPAKLEVLDGFIFRVSKPAIVGIKVVGGVLRPGVRLMRSDGTEVGQLKSLQRENESVGEAPEGSELAASIDGAVVGRNLKARDVLWVSLPEAAARALKDQPLSPVERTILDEVLRMRRSVHPFWGQ